MRGTNAFFVSILGVVAVVLGLKWGSLRQYDPNLFKGREKTYKERIEELGIEVKRLNGTIHKQKQKFQVDGEYDLDNQGDLASLAKSILPNILEFLPQNVQQQAKGLLTNPDLIDLLEEIHKQFPKETKSLLAGFIKGGAKSPGSQTPQLEAGQTIKFDPRGA